MSRRNGCFSISFGEIGVFMIGWVLHVNPFVGSEGKVVSQAYHIQFSLVYRKRPARPAAVNKQKREAGAQENARIAGERVWE